MPAERARRPSLPARVALALAPVLLLLGGWELALRLGGDAGLDPSRGFDAGAAYLVPDPDVPGGWRTQIFGGERTDAEVRVPPRGAGPRVLLLGGSNTELLPHFLLEERLRADDGRPWEVVNLGRRGYGSRRVRILLEQAWVLAPDALVIYSGHNEFVERGFAEELAARDAEQRLPRLRVVEQVRRWLAPARPAMPLQRADPALRATFPAETDERLAAYADNLRAMLRAAAARDVPVLLCTPLGNPLAAPYVDTLPADLPAADGERAEALLLAARRRLPERLFEFVRPVGRAPLRLRFDDWYRPHDEAVAGGPLAPAPRARPLLPPLDHAPALARGDARCDSMEGHHWPPVAGWRAEVHTLLRAMVPLLGRAVTADERARLAALVPRYEEVLGIVPDHPGALYDLGLLRYVLDDDPAEAVRLLRAAAAADRAPRAANDRINDLVRGVAAEQTGATLLDVEAAYRAANPDGLPGFELLMDNCHLQPGVRVHLMQWLAEELPALVD